jgi:hypothetical protein
MIVPTADDEITLDIPDTAQPAGERRWMAGDLTVELSPETATDPLSRPFDIDEWLEAFARDVGEEPEALVVTQPAPPDDVGCVASHAGTREIRMILFSHDNGDLRTARIILGNRGTEETAHRLRIRSRSRGYEKALGDILGGS